MAILVGLALLLASATTLALVVRGQGPPPATAHLAIRYEGVLCSRQGCLLQTVAALCRTDDVEALRMRVDAVSADDTRAVILVTYRARPGVGQRLVRIANEPFRPFATEPWVGHLPNWYSGYCRPSTPS